LPARSRPAEPWPERLFGRALALADRPLAAGLALLLIAAAVLLPGQAALPVTDRDEARFVIASRQMLETGDVVDIRNQDAPRWKKPVGIYWLQAASAAAAGGPAEAGIRAYRLPSLAGIAGAGLLVAWAFAPVAGRRAAFLAAVITLTSALAIVEGHIAKTDAALLACVVAAHGALLRIARARDRRRFDLSRAVFWLALAAGTLIKGPIIWMAVALPLAWMTVAARDWRLPLRLGPWPGPALFALVTLPWFVAIGVRTDWAFYAESLGRDLVGKVGEGQESHGAPPGFYLATIWVTLWPWAPLVLTALPAAWAARRTEAMRYAAGAVVPFWLVYAAVATKLVHYLLPVFPALALVAAVWLADPKAAPAPRALRWIAAALLLLPGLVLAAATAAVPAVLGDGPGPAAAAAALAVAILTGLAAWLLAAGRPRASAVAALPAALLLAPSVVALTLPASTQLFPSPRMAGLHATWQDCAPRPLVSVGYHEPSLVVAAGTDTRLADAQAAAGLLAAEPGWRIFLDPSRGPDHAEMSARAGMPLQRLATIDALNYNGGGATTIELVARAGDPLLAPCTPAP